MDAVVRKLRKVARAPRPHPYSPGADARRRLRQPRLPLSHDELYLDKVFGGPNPLDLLSSNLEAGEFEEGRGVWLPLDRP